MHAAMSNVRLRTLIYTVYVYLSQTTDWHMSQDEDQRARRAALNAIRAAKRAASPVALFAPASTVSPPPLPPSSRPASGTSTLAQRNITAVTSCPGYHHVTVACVRVSGREEGIKSG
jgi:hypothetical protein